jgi:hypothetical protein
VAWTGPENSTAMVVVISIVSTVAAIIITALVSHLHRHPEEYLLELAEASQEGGEIGLQDRRADVK